MVVGVTMVWFAVASALVVGMWRLNVVNGGGYSVGGVDVETKFTWFGGGGDYDWVFLVELMLN